MSMAVLLLLHVALHPLPLVLDGQTPQALVDRAEADFSAGRIAESVAEFDRLVVLVPSTAPVLWQRGIGLYFLGRYDECAAQFAAYYSVNPTDVENAAWHFLCVARGHSREKARASLLHAGPDPRIMRTEIYEMLLGRLTPADLVAAAGTSVPVAQFYAHLYAGLYFDALGDHRSALAETTLAASDQLRSEGGFMNVVAHIHLDMLRRSEAGRDSR